MHLDKSLSFKENYMNDKLWVKHGVTYNFKQNNELWEEKISGSLRPIFRRSHNFMNNVVFVIV